jgi:non-homologous end joining protein Ku
MRGDRRRDTGTGGKEFVHEKMQGNTVVAKEAERPTGRNPVDLMEALKRSIGEAGADTTKPARGGKKRA